MHLINYIQIASNLRCGTHTHTQEGKMNRPHVSNWHAAASPAASVYVSICSKKIRMGYKTSWKQCRNNNKIICSAFELRVEHKNVLTLRIHNHSSYRSYTSFTRYIVDVVQYRRSGYTHTLYTEIPQPIQTLSASWRMISTTWSDGKGREGWMGIGYKWLVTTLFELCCYACSRDAVNIMYE